MRISKVCIMLLAAMSFFSACEDYDYDEPADIDSDMGFDPYMGCFSDDC